mmetsp:Transcript_44966/g.59675  ORF Transcript_44966/g.59675 Transcript_44966/m.59675 type:complete len:150 (+) Transcript_44966:1580-2029(+)
MPENEPFLDDFEITKESIKEDDLESFKEKLSSIVFADSRLFFKLIISQGYDLHLTRAVLPTYDLSQCGNMKLLSRNLPLLRQVLSLIETHYCKENQVVASLSPSMIRIAALTPDLQVSKEDEEDSVKQKMHSHFSSEATVLPLFPEVSA